MNHKIKLFFVFLIFVFVMTSCKESNYKIILIDEHGDIKDIYQAADTDDFPALSDYIPNKEGYSFLNWDLVLDESDIKIFQTTFEINQYIISFDSSGGSHIAVLTLDYQEMIPVIEVPIKDNMYFAGWFLDANFNEAFDLEIMPSKNVSLYAKWSSAPLLYRLDENNDAIITGILVETEELIIPEQIDGYDIVSIDVNAFYEHFQIKQLTIPNTVTHLPQALLKDLTQLEYLKTPFVGENREPSRHTSTLVYFFYTEEYSSFYNVAEVASNIPETLIEIYLTDSVIVGDFAFASSPVKWLSLNEGITTIGLHAFNDSDIGIISLPASVLTIDSSSFINMKELKIINVAEDNPNFSGSFLGRALFNKDYTKLIKYSNGFTSPEYYVPEGVFKIEEYAFAYNSNLVKVYIPDSVTEIGTYAFAHTQQLSTVEFSPNSGLKKIERAAFENSSIVYISIPKTIETIGDFTFNNARRLESIMFLNDSQLNQIGTHAFYGTLSLNEIIIPISVNTIGADVFGNVVSQLIIYCEAISKPDGWHLDWYRSNTLIDIVWNYTSN